MGGCSAARANDEVRRLASGWRRSGYAEPPGTLLELKALAKLNSRLRAKKDEMRAALPTAGHAPPPHS
jgi:hypothetical protein